MKKKYIIKLTKNQIDYIRLALKDRITTYDNFISENEEYTPDWLFDERQEYNEILTYLSKLTKDNPW